MFDSEDEERLYQEAVDMLDVKYIDGEAYMSIHTVDLMNANFMDVIDAAQDASERGVPTLPPDAIHGMLWVMTIWRQLHDELEIRAETLNLPDTVPENFDKE